MKNKCFEFVLSKSNLIKLIEKYYSDEGRNVSVKIDYNIKYNFDNYELKGDYITNTVISACEKVTIAGMNLTKEFNLSMEEVKEIVKNVFEKDGYEFVDLSNDASSKESIFRALTETNYGRTIINKTFTVSARVKEDAKVLQKKKGSN